MEQYTDLFDKYTNNANGKQVLASALSRIMQETSRKSLLDIGAGNGEITRLIAPHFEGVDVIEPKRKYVEHIKNLNIANLSAFESDIQSYQTQKRYDSILLSYVLESISIADYPAIFEKLKAILNLKGNIYCATYLDGCDWDEFSYIVKARIDLARTGGFYRVLSSIRDCGYSIREREIVSTQIYGESLENLYENLAFFFKRGLDQYINHKQDLIAILERYTERSNDGRFYIEVKEVIFNIYV